MKKVVIIAALLAFNRFAVATERGPSPTIQRLDPAFDKVVPPGAVVEKIAENHKWVEGPVWNKRDKYLLFSDIPNNAIFKWQESHGDTLFMKPSGYMGKAPYSGLEAGSNGLTYDPQGRLVMCVHGERAIVRIETDGRRTTLVDRYEGKRLNSPNDAVYTSKGDLYFSDPPFGLAKWFEDPKKELPFSGVYRYSKDGVLTLLTKELNAPNGIAFSPDEKTLYISDSNLSRATWWAFPVNADGTLGPRRLLFESTSISKTRHGVADGLKVDARGNLFATGPGGIYVITPQGDLLGWINFGGPVGNCAFGEDGSTLFITAAQSVYRLRLSSKSNGSSLL